MIFKRRNLVILLTILTIGILSILSLLNIIPRNIFSIQEKPLLPIPKNYDYYIIVDEIDNHNLMYVPLIVNIGDEVISEENKRYKVIKIEQNRAIARYIEDVNLEEYKKK